MEHEMNINLTKAFQNYLKHKKIKKTKAVEDFFSSLILSGQFTPEQKLPNTGELAKILGLGRITVHHAFSKLLEAGLVERKAGAGTFIKKQNEKSLQPKKTTTAGLLFNWQNYQEDIKKIETHFAEKKIRLIRMDSNINQADSQLENGQLRALAEGGAQIIFSGLSPCTHKPLAEPELLRKTIRNICLLPHWKDMSDFDYVMPDYGGNTVRAAFELAKQGFQKIWLCEVKVPYNYAKGEAWKRGAAVGPVGFSALSNNNKFIAAKSDGL